MIGAIHIHQLQQMLSESSGGTWVDIKTSFDYYYMAAKDFAKETKTCTNSQTITTTARQSNYPLNPDYLEVLTRDDDDNAVISYYDGASTQWLTWETYGSYLQNGNTAGTPDSFAITPSSVPSRITGSTTNSSTQVGGETTLTDSAATLFSTCYPGDDVVNVTENFNGVVLAVGTTLTTAMFNLATRGGTYAGWRYGDVYMIQPAPRYQLFLDPPPVTAGQVITVPYFAKPLPVYSDYGMYPFATGYEETLMKYAAWLYKYRDSKPQLADPLFMAYERDMRKAKTVNRKAVGAKGFRVNFMIGSN